MEPIRLDKAALKARFGLTERLAVRILALRRNGLDVTEALLEEVRRRPEIEEMLLSAALLEAAGTLTADGMAGLFADRRGLTVASAGGRILALEEELLADEAETEGAAMVPAASAPGRFRFSPQELEAIRLAIVTSVDAGTKIEALRKLAHADATAEEKGAAFLRALLDSDARVRVEALGGLERVGLEPALADALRGLGHDSVARRRLALQRVAGRIESASEAERRIILSCLLSELGGEPPADLLAELVGALEPFAAGLGADPEWLGRLCKTLLRSLADHYHAIKKPVVRLFDLLSPHIDEAGAAVLDREIAAIGDRRIQALFMGLLSRVAVPPAMRARLAESVAQVLATSFGEEIEARDLLEVGRRLGDEQVAACLAALDRVGDEYLPNFIRSLDLISDGDAVSPSVLDRLAEAYLRLVQTKGRIVRMALLESAIFFNPRVPPAARERFAGDLLSNLHLYRLDRQVEQIEAVVTKIGPAALPALRHAASRSPHDIERSSALKLIPELAGRAGGGAEELLDFLEKLERDKSVPRGPLVVCTAKVAGLPSTSPERARKVFQGFRERLGRPGESFELILGLGLLASSPPVGARDAVELALELMASLEGKLPDPQVSTVETEDGPRLTFGRETLTYTDFVPNVLEALRRIYASDKLPTGIRIMLTRRLLKRWETLANFEEVWAPGNLVELAETLSQFARNPATPPELRDETIGALVLHARNTTIARILSETLVFYDDEGPEYGRVVEEFGRRLLEMFAAPEYQNPDDRRTILTALGRLAGHARLARSKKESEGSRERIADLLVEHLSPSFREGYRLVRALSESKHAPAPLRRRLEGVVDNGT
jgi:hypothetical protein